MNCIDWEERIALYAGGDLAPAEAEAVKLHVAECGGCQLLLSGLRQSLETVREAHGELPDAAHFAAVRARVLAELERGPNRRWRWMWAPAMAAAAMALLMALWPRPPQSLVLPLPPAPAAAPPEIAKAVPVRHAPRPRKLAAKLREPSEPLVVKLLTDDPDVVIYWITGTKGE